MITISLGWSLEIATPPVCNKHVLVATNEDHVQDLSVVRDSSLSDMARIRPISAHRRCLIPGRPLATSTEAGRLDNVVIVDVVCEA